MVKIADALQELKTSLPSQVCLVAVSKKKPFEAVLEAYEAGQRVFGENHAQEMAEKAEKGPKDIQWHFIGHLQRNKVKYIAPHVSLIHSIDSTRLLEEVNKQGQKLKRTIPVLLQLKIASEDSKYGLSFSQAKEILDLNSTTPYSNIEIHGLMGMATHTENKEVVKSEFDQLYTYFTQLKSIQGPNVHFQHCSMGMSGDYPIAIESGSNMVRVGSLIFGAR